MEEQKVKQSFEGEKESSGACRDGSVVKSVVCSSKAPIRQLTPACNTNSRESDTVKLIHIKYKIINYFKKKREKKSSGKERSQRRLEVCTREKQVILCSQGSEKEDAAERRLLS